MGGAEGTHKKRRKKQEEGTIKTIKTKVKRCSSHQGDDNAADYDKEEKGRGRGGGGRGVGGPERMYKR